MQSFSYTPRGVCSRQIEFSIEDGKLCDVRFTGGCDGNLKAISMLVEGPDAREIADLFRGNTCGRRPTSCADQFATAIDLALEE